MISKMLRGQHARVLLDDSEHFRIMDANESFADLLLCGVKNLLGCDVDVLHCKGTDQALLRDTLSKADEGCESSCGVILTQDMILFHVWCISALDNRFGKCKLCVLKPMMPPKEPRGIDFVAAAVSPLPPYHIIEVSAPWNQLFGYRPDEMRGRSLKILQGPQTDAHAFRELMSSVRRCVPAETALLSFRKDGAAFLVRLRLCPFQVAEGSVAVLVQATPLSHPSDVATAAPPSRIEDEPAAPPAGE